MSDTQTEPTGIRRKRATKSLVWMGLACLILGVLCYLLSLSMGSGG